MKKMLCILLLLAGITNAAAYAISDSYEYEVSLYGNDSIEVTGGGADHIEAFNYATINIIDTAPLQANIGGIEAITLNDNTTLSVLGGYIDRLYLEEYSKATLSGGSINKIFSYQDAYSPNQVYQPHIEIICREYDDSVANLITGIWDVDNDGDGSYDTFSIELKNQTGYDPVIDNIKFTIVPEPCSLVLLGLGGLLIRRM